MPSGIGFTESFGVGVTGKYAAIRSNAVATDAAGDSFITGSFRGTAAFDPNSSSSNFTTNSTQDTFIAKYGATGSLLWATTFAGQATTNSGGFITYAVSQGSAIAVDGSGNVFVAGSFSGTIDYMGASGVSQAASTASATEPFVAKLDPSGHVTWFDAVAGTAYDTDSANALALDGSGGAVIGGSFEDSATFGSTKLAASGSSDAFAARVNGDGTFLWTVATQGANGSNASAQGVAVDGSGNVDLAGFFSGSVDFDPSSGTTTLTSAGSDDAMLWKLNQGGKFLWARSYGSTDYDAATAVAVDASGDLIATGAFSDTVNFGTASTPDSVTAGPVYDTFLLKVNPNGNEAWVRGLVGPSGSSKGQGVAVDFAGNVHLAGTFSGPLSFSGTDTLTSVGSSDVFSAGYDGNGNPDYALQAGQANFSAALGVAVNASGIVAMTGTYSGSIVFGPTTLPNFGAVSVFVAQVTTQFPPPAPSATVLEASSDSGISQTDGITNDTSPVLDVNTAGTTNTVELLRNGVAVAHRIGPGALQDPGPLADGTYTYTGVQVSPFGLVGPAGPSCSVTILTVPPVALPAPTLDAADDSGTLGDGITNVKQPRLAVVVKGGLTVQLLNATASVISSAYQASSGTCLVSLAQPLADGVYPIRARAVDVAGNIGPAGSAFTLTIDTTPPAAPSVPTLLAADDSGTLGDGITNVRQPRLTGTTESGSTVQVVDGKGNVYGSAVASSNGAFTVTMNASLADGTYVLSARATDAAGNQGPSGPSMTLTILATPPAAPPAPALYAADDSGGPGLTNVRQPRLTGQTAPNASVQLIGPSGSVLASATSASNGTYLARLTSPLADGTYAIHAVATDAAGNVSPPGSAFSLTILATPPAAPSAPTLLAQDDSGTVGDGITNVRQPRLTATATPGLTVRLVNASNVVLGTGTASGGGSVTVSPLSPLGDGTYTLSFVAIDAAGNVSGPGGTISLTILATPPPQPSPPTLIAADDTGVLGDGMTSVRRPRLVGTASPGGRIDWLAANGSVLASTTASVSTGSYQLQASTALPNGVYPVTVRETDVAGNVSPTSKALTLTIRADPGDDFGDGETDISAFRTTDAYFFVQRPKTGALFLQQFGGPGDVPIDGDFFGNGHNDIAIFRPSSSTFFAFDPITGAFKSSQFGQVGDVPVPADYDGDGQTDFAVFVPSTATFLVQMSATNTTYTHQFGGAGDVPVPADYFGNGHADLAFYRPSDSTFYVYDPIAGGAKIVTVGLPGSTPVPADYEGLGHADPAVYEPGTSTFLIQMSATNSTYSRQFGSPGDIPIPGDYFGNGRVDLAVYQPSAAAFLELDIATNAAKIVGWGTPYVTWPTMAPITTWFSFGSGPTPNAIKIAAPSASVIVDDVPIPLTLDVGVVPSPSQAHKSKAADLAIDSLSLERWRPET